MVLNPYSCLFALCWCWGQVPVNEYNYENTKGYKAIWEAGHLIKIYWVPTWRRYIACVYRPPNTSTTWLLAITTVLIRLPWRLWDFSWSHVPFLALNQTWLNPEPWQELRTPLVVPHASQYSSHRPPLGSSSACRRHFAEVSSDNGSWPRCISQGYGFSPVL